VTGNGYLGAFDKPSPAGSADLLPPPMDSPLTQP